MDRDTLKKIKGKIQHAYDRRDDYPPFRMTPFEDRPVYHEYIQMLIEEALAAAEAAEEE